MRTANETAKSVSNCNSDMSAQEFKLLLIGDGGVGKTTFVKRHMTGEFEKRYIPTVGADVHKLKFVTNYGDIIFNVWDTAGQEKLAGLRDGYYVNGQCAIIMFDVSNRITYRNLSNWYREVVRVCENIPTCLVGNKVDVQDRQVKAKNVTFHRRHNISFYEVSARASLNFEKPFRSLARILTGKSDLTFEGEYAKPPELHLDEAQKARIEEEFNAAANAAIEDDDADL